MTTTPTNDRGAGLPWICVHVESSAEKLELIRELAVEGASHPDVRDIAFRLTWRHRANQLEQAAAVHAWCRATLRFFRERVETFQRAWYTLHVGAGDCDDHVILQTALALVVGLPVMLVPWNPMDHIAVGYDFGGRGPVWSETTIPAYFGEDPLVALRRLGISNRSDIA